MAKQTTSYIKLAAVSLIYLLLCILFFTSTAIPFKIAYPVASLLISALWVSPWQIAAALLCAAVGDVMGAKGIFLWQMGAFAMSHLFLIWYFVSRFFKMNGMTSVKNILFTTIIVICVCVFAILIIIPEVPAGIVRNGATIYAIIISIMLWCALLQKDSAYAVGAILFVISDLVLAWNRFVSPVPYSSYMIMIPYYASQLLFFARSVKA